MTLDQIRNHCLKKKGRVTEGFPFGEDVLVFKVNGKMFLLARLDEHPLSVNLKCDPERAVELRERQDAVQPGYHMNKKYWNTVMIDGSVSPREILEMIDHSYDEVVKTLGKTMQQRLLTK